MAKAKVDAKAGEPLKPVKKTVSISGVFKNARKQQSYKDDRQRLTSSFRLSSRADKFSSKHKPKPPPKHPLFADFEESLDKNKEHIKEEVTNAVDATTKELLQRIQTSEEDFSRRVAAAAINDEAFFLPLAEEGIEYARRDGSQSSKTTLGAQMKMFRKKVAAEEKELESLWKQWAQVEEELEVAAVEALGIDWPTILAGVSAGNLGETVKNDMGENEEAVERDCKRFEELINTTSEAAVDKMAQSEKEFKIQQNECQKSMLKLFDDVDAAAEE